MPARIYSHFPERKITNPSPPKDHGPGSSASVKVKQAFTSVGLPGKASNWYGKKGKVVKKYPASKGLC